MLDSTTRTANTNTTGISNLWLYATSVSTTAWDTYADVQNMIDNVGDITNTNPNDYDTNGLFGKSCLFLLLLMTRTVT